MERGRLYALSRALERERVATGAKRRSSGEGISSAGAAWPSPSPSLRDGSPPSPAPKRGRGSKSRDVICDSSARKGEENARFEAASTPRSITLERGQNGSFMPGGSGRPPVSFDISAATCSSTLV